MCENLRYESVYFKELHNDQECYWPTIYRAGAAVVWPITTLISANIIASHAGVFRGARFSPLPREGWNTCSPKNAYVGGYQYHFSNLIWYCERDSLQKHSFLLALRRWGRFARNVPSGEERRRNGCFRRLRARRRGDFREPCSILSDDGDGSENVFQTLPRLF